MSHRIDMVTLQGLKNKKTLDKWRAERGNIKVRIWSGEWRMYWRANGSGYTSFKEEAGIYTFEEACKYSAHCGASKRIKYELLEPIRTK